MNSRGNILTYVLVIMIISFMLCTGSLLLICNYSKVVTRKVDYLNNELIIKNTLYDVLNEVVINQSINDVEVAEYKINFININNNTYKIELYDDNIVLITIVNFDFTNTKYKILVSEVKKDE